MHMASMRESRDSDQFLVNTQVQSHALLCRGFGTSVPFIAIATEAFSQLFYRVLVMTDKPMLSLTDCPVN